MKKIFVSLFGILFLFSTAAECLARPNGREMNPPPPAPLDEDGNPMPPPDEDESDYDDYE